MIAAPFWSTIDRTAARAAAANAPICGSVFSSLLITGPFSILLGFDGRHDGAERPAEAALAWWWREKGEHVFISPARSAPSARWSRTLERIWAPRGRRAGDCAAERRVRCSMTYCDLSIRSLRWCATTSAASHCRVCERQCANGVHRYDPRNRTHDGRRRRNASTASAAWRSARRGR